MVLAYYVALRFSWYSPTWVAFSVAMISLGSVGESLAKGVLRAKGTFIAFFTSLFLLGLFPQDRWLMLLALSLFMAFVGYKITGKNGQYGWFVTGFVTMMIVSSSSQSSANVFDFAAYRTLETLAGISIWALTSVFLWPQSNTGALNKLREQLIQAEQKLLSIYHSKLVRQDFENDFQSAHDKAIKLLAKLDQAIDSASFESLEVREKYQHWEERKETALHYMAMLARLDSGLPDLQAVNVTEVLPALEQFFAEQDLVFNDALAEDSGAVTLESKKVALSIDEKSTRSINQFERAAIEVLRNDLERCGAIISLLANPSDEVFGSVVEEESFARSAVGPMGIVPLDPDRVKGAMFVVASVWTGALLWIYVNPPGHAAWLNLLPTIALIWVQMPHVKLPLIKFFAVGFLIVMPVYIFVMPEFSMFSELGLLLWILCFLNVYLLSGLMVSVGFLAIINMLGISNEQSYNVAAMMNTYVFFLLVMVVVTMLSYILGAFRPEKVFLKMIRRYFHSSEIILSALGDKPADYSLYQRLRLAYHQQELQLLPAKLGIWGGAIDSSEFPDAAPANIQAVVTTLESLTYQVEDLCVLRRHPEVDSSIVVLRSDIREWRLALMKVFTILADGQLPQKDLAAKLASRMESITVHTEEIIEQGRVIKVEDKQKLYRLLGGFRRLSQEVVVYAGVAGQINWSDLHREHF